MSKQLNWAHWIAGQAGVVPLSLGIPGVAKTAMHAALAEQLGYKFIPIMLDQWLPEDIGGYPIVRDMHDADGVRHDVMRKILDERMLTATLYPCVMLFDEVTNCGHSTQASALQVLNTPIPGTMMFAAANPIDKAAAGVDLTPPMVNRLCVRAWETDTEAVLTGWRHGFNFPAPQIPILPKDWQSYCTRWGSLLAMFIERKPELLEAFPADLAKASEPYPTPRSWTNAGKLLAAAESVDALPHVQNELVKGCVGEGACNEFFSWLEQQGLPDPEWLLEHPERLAMPRRGDLAIAILQGVLGSVRRNNTPDRWESCCTLFEYAYDSNAEVTMSAVGSLLKCKPGGHMPKARNGRWRDMQEQFLATSSR